MAINIDTEPSRVPEQKISTPIDVLENFLKNRPEDYPPMLNVEKTLKRCKALPVLIGPQDLRLKDQNPAEYERLRRAIRKSNWQKVTEMIQFKKEAVGLMFGALAYLIDTNPDRPAGELVEIADRYASGVGLLDDEVEIVHMGLEEYHRRHIAVESEAAKYRDSVGLYKGIFGRNPIGPVDIIKGPMTLYLRCHSSRDFTKAYASLHMKLYGGALSEGESGQLPNTIATFFQTPYPSINPDEDFPLKGCIILEQALGSPVDQSVVDHEVEHAVRDLLESVYLNGSLAVGSPSVIHAEFLKSINLSEKNLRVLKRDLTGFLTAEYRLTEDLTSDEMLAYLVQQMNTDEIVEIMTAPIEEGGGYDRFPFHWRRELASRITLDLGRDWRGFVNGLIDSIFVTGHRNNIYFGLEAFKQLVKFYQEAGTPDPLGRAVDYARLHQLHKWPKDFNRLIKQRQAKNTLN